MLLCKLTDDVIADGNKEIKLIQYSENYLEELKAKYSDICSIDVCSDGYESYLEQDFLFVIAVDYYREVYECVCKDIGSACDYTIYYFANKETEYEEFYRNKYKNDALKDIIIFRSGPHIDSYIKGMDFADNAKALFEYMLENGYNARYELIWFVKDRMEYVDRYSMYNNVDFVNLEWSKSDVKSQRDTYYYYLCLAKYIFFTDAYGIARNSREDQIRVQLWHGCGFKTRLNFQPCNKRYEYMIVTSKLYAGIHRRLFGLDEKQMLITGLPKEDWLYEETDKHIDEVICNNKNKLILWLPTYREADDVLGQKNGYIVDGITGLPVLDTYKKIYKVNEVLIQNEMDMLIKLHPFQKKDCINIDQFSNIHIIDNGILADMGIHINQILGKADALISDYSSVAVDYLLLDRPIGFAVDDLEQYSEARGFIFDNIEEWLPGVILKNENDIIKYIEDVADNIDVEEEKRKRLTSLFHDNCSGNNCKRLLDTLGIRVYG